MAGMPARPVFVTCYRGIGYSIGRESEHFSEDGADTEKVIEAGGFLQVKLGAEAIGVGAILGGVGGTQDDDGDAAKRTGPVTAFENVAAGAFRKIEIENKQIRARSRHIEVFDEADGVLAIAEYDDLADDAVFFEGGTDKTDVCGVIFDENNGDETGRMGGAGFTRGS
jgi:hypothetical protein